MRADLKHEDAEERSSDTDTSETPNVLLVASLE